MEQKYVIVSFDENDECVGYLSAFSPTGMNQFHPQITQAIPFDSIADCVYSDGQPWKLGRAGGNGYYKIEKTTRYKAESSDLRLTPMREFRKWFDENKSSALNHDIGKKITELIEKEKQVIIGFSNELVEIQVDGCGCYKNGGMEEEAEKLFNKIFKH